MSDIKEIKTLVDKAKRDESKAFNEMTSDEVKAGEQKSQLEACQTYREECLEGLKSAKTSGLSIVQIRECQVLMQHLDSVLETRQYKADISQESYEKLKKVWVKKNDHYEQLRETLEKAIEERQNTMVGGDEAILTETYDAFKNGKK
jgi:flagellar biosynthesis chaperone FliJ